jgi:hypothetical protein
MIPLRRSRRTVLVDHITPPPVTRSSVDYGHDDTKLAAAHAELADTQARVDRLADELDAALAELAIRPAADPVLRRLAVEGPACTDVLAAELNLTSGEVAARLGHATAAGRVVCITTPNGPVWGIAPTATARDDCL